MDRHHTPHGLEGVDLSRVGEHGDDARFLKDMVLRADAQVAKYEPMTVQERLAAFRRIGYRPHGLYLPSDHDWEMETRRRLRAIGELDNLGLRMQQYHALQDETEGWAQQGVPGQWIGQQAIARSAARYRIAGQGRRAGKTYHASREAVAVAITKARATVWICAPTLKLVTRCFDMIADFVQDLGLKTQIFRNTKDDRLIVLDNGARFEGVSLENVWSAAGAAVDFAIVDEAAQLVPEAWHRGVAPPLADRNGQALIISSWEGDEGFFFEQARRTQEEGDGETWAVFIGESWHNFYQFPQGRDTPTIRQLERDTPPDDFLEQFGAVPQHAKNLIYPEFHERVHVNGNIRFDPDHPVELAIDPSSGANQYAIAVLQDYGDLTHVIDEYYEVHRSAEEAMEWVRAQDWQQNVTDVVMDSESPMEVERWLRGGFQAFPVPDKPHVEDRFPVYRRLLRDPRLYYEFYQEKLQEELDRRDIPLDDYLLMSARETAPIIVAVRERLAWQNIDGDDLGRLVRCSHIFFASKCHHCVDEHKRYSYAKRRQVNLNVPESPRKWRDHLMDALGYWAWWKKRWDYYDSLDTPTNYLRTVPASGRMPQPTKEPAPIEPITPQTRGMLWLRHMRDQHEPNTRSWSFLERV